MRKTLRCCALVLALVLVLSAGTPARAAFGDIRDHPHREAIGRMAALGILEGYGDGRFGPEAPLDRAQAAKVAGILLGFGTGEAAAAAGRVPVFQDVRTGLGAHSWAAGWIHLAAREGVLRGTGAGLYEPGEPLQMVQWAAILLRILGHEEPGMSWPADYDRLAGETGLARVVDYDGASPLTRAQMAALTDAAIHAVPDARGGRLLDTVDFPGVPDPAEEVSGTLSLRLLIAPSRAPGGGEQAVEVRVLVSEDGEPREGVLVLFRADRDGAGRTDRISRREAMTGPDGIARVEYTTMARDDDHQVRIAAEARVEGRLVARESFLYASESAGIIQGFAIHPFTGAPLVRMPVDIGGPQPEQIYYATTDDQGAYLAYRPSGSYTVSFFADLRGVPGYDGQPARGSGFGIAGHVLEYQAAVDLAPGQSAALHFRAGILRGRLPGAGPGETVFFHPEGDRLARTAVLRPDGSFLAPLPPGTYEVRRADGVRLWTGVAVRAGTVTDLGDGGG